MERSSTLASSSSELRGGGDRGGGDRGEEMEMGEMEVEEMGVGKLEMDERLGWT